jgi:hypothetical protein
MRRIISLTSIPPRFRYLKRTLRSLVSQDAAVDRVELYVPETSNRFAQADLPQDLPGGVDVIRLDRDYGPATKLLGAARRHSGTDVQIAVCDDDHVYPPDWARCLFETQASRPGEAVTLNGRSVSRVVGAPVEGHAPPGPYAQMRGKHDTPRLHAIRLGHKLLRSLSLRRLPDAASPAARVAGYSDIVFGFAGFCVRAEFVDAPFFDIVPPYALVDDVWFSGHLARRGVPIWVPQDGPMPRALASSRVAPLIKTKVEARGRDDLNALTVRYFQETHGVWGRPASQPLAS